MHPIFQILVGAIWAFFAWQTSKAYITKLKMEFRINAVNVPVAMTISTAILAVLPIFIGALLKAVL
jgi:hypothetical protein